MEKPKYEKEICSECGQFKTYLLPLDRGTATIVKAFSTAVRNKGINIIHPTKEMEVPAKEWSYERAIHAGVLTSTQIGNFTRARVHGLIARVKGEAGNWCLTTKGSQFLKGQKVPQFAIIRKSKAGERSHKDEYFEPEKFQIDIYELSKQEEVWMGIDFEIQEGRIVEDLPVKKEKVDNQNSLL